MQDRSVIDVANQILLIIPDTEYLLKSDIENMVEGFSYQSPESRRGSWCWISFTNILNYHVKVFDKEWKLKTRNIINNKACINVDTNGRESIGVRRSIDPDSPLKPSQSV